MLDPFFQIYSAILALQNVQGTLECYSKLKDKLGLKTVDRTVHSKTSSSLHIDSSVKISMLPEMQIIMNRLIII